MKPQAASVPAARRPPEPLVIPHGKRPGEEAPGP